MCGRLHDQRAVVVGDGDRGLLERDRAQVVDQRERQVHLLVLQNRVHGAHFQFDPHRGGVGVQNGDIPQAARGVSSPWRREGSLEGQIPKVAGVRLIEGSRLTLGIADGDLEGNQWIDRIGGRRIHVGRSYVPARSDLRPWKRQTGAEYLLGEV